jgi:uncharacterized repeat protein (TIGR03803 family)
MKNFCYVALLVCFPILSVAAFGQTVNEVFAFSNANSSGTPAGSPVQGRDGKLYGATNGFGQTVVTDGTVFRLSTGGRWSSLHSFTGSDGQNPSAGLILAIDGNYYGTAQYGGSAGWGVLFRVTPSGTFTVLYQFTGGTDGGHPASALIQASDGNLYGTTFPGTVDDGTVYKYVLSTGTFATILSLNQDQSQGRQISAPVVQAADGSLYGTAIFGGANGCGTIFRVATSGTLLQVYSFPCGAGGSSPSGPLIQASDGSFYGTTSVGGNVTSQGECQSGCGTIFRLSQDLVTVLYRFSGYPNDGGVAASGLVQGTDGNLYGGTFKGGVNDQGVLYQITTTGQYKLLYSFAERIGHGANSAPMQHTNGKFYGVTTYGGRYSEGALYSLSMGLGPFIALVRYTGRVGQPLQILGQGLTGSTAITINGAAVSNFKVVSDTFMTATIPSAATTGPVVVTTPNGTLTSNHALRIEQ